jgi:uncharacterized phage infection (PIP) family protein YhgE
MKALIREHEEWVEERTSSQPLVKEMKDARSKARNLLDSAQKAHDAMVELVQSNEEMHDSYMKWEDARARASSRTSRLENALSSSQDALSFWKDRVQNDNFSDLLIDANRVREGGQSSKSIARAKKAARELEEKKNAAGVEEE